MGSGASLAAAGSAKAAVTAGVVASGTAKVAVGAVRGDDSGRELISDGLQDVKEATSELLCGGVSLVATTVAVACAGAAGGLARVVEGGPGPGLRGALLEAPAAAVSHAAGGAGPLGVLAGAFVAGHGSGGAWQESTEESRRQALVEKEALLQSIGTWSSPSPADIELPLSELAALARAVYAEPPQELPGWRCDLACVRDPEEEVEAQMAVFLRPGGSRGKQAQRDLAVIAIRGTADVHDRLRDWRSVVMYSYPKAFVEAAAELTRMFHEQGCDVMITGHSLGGYLAEVVATSLGLPGAGFCAPGPGFHNGPGAGLGFVTVNHEADTIGNHNHDFHVRPPVYILDGGLLMLPWTAHSMAEMVKYMSKREDWTNLNAVAKCSAELPRVPLRVFAGPRSRRD